MKTILKSSVIRVLNVQQDKVEGGGIRQFLSSKGDQNSLRTSGFATTQYTCNGFL